MCKRTAGFVAEALECLGGNGYVEDSGLPLLYREAPLNSVWEGSGNVNALDVLRALAREPEALAAWITEVGHARGADARLDRAVDDTLTLLGESGSHEAGARRLAGRMAACLQGSLLVRYAPAEVADAFCGSRLGTSYDGTYGTLSTSVAELQPSWSARPPRSDPAQPGWLSSAITCLNVAKRRGPTCAANWPSIRSRAPYTRFMSAVARARAVDQPGPAVRRVGRGGQVTGAGEVGHELAAALLGHSGAAGELGDVDAIARDGGEDADVGHPEVAQGAVGELRRIRPNRPAISSGSTSSCPALINPIYHLARRLGSFVVPARLGQPRLESRTRPRGRDHGHPQASVDVATLRAPGPKRGGLGSGLVDDFIGDIRPTAGTDQAVYAFAREELDFWERRLGVDLANGSFGQNLTTLDLDVDASLVGDRWAIGDEVVLEVTGPRVPCATFAARMGVPWLAEDVHRGRPQWRLPRRGPGRRGTAGRRGARGRHRPDHDVDVPTTFRAFMGDLEAAEHVLAVGCLVEHEQAALRDQVDRRRAKGA